MTQAPTTRYGSLSPAIAFALAVVVGSMSACAQTSPSGGEIVAEFADQKVTLGDFKNYLRVSGLSDGHSPDDSRFKSRLLDQFLEESLLVYAAAQSGFSVDREAIDATLRHLPTEKSASSSEGSGAPELSAEYREEIRRMLLVRSYLENVIVRVTTVPSEEVERYYQENSGEFDRSEQVEIRQIFLSIEEEADRILELLQKGEGDFDDLARRHSQSPDLGRAMLHNREEMFPAFSAAIDQLEEGQLSPVIESPHGYHIFRLENRIAGEHLTLEQVAPRINAELASDLIEGARTTLLASLKEAYGFTLDRRSLDFTYFSSESLADESQAS